MGHGSILVTIMMVVFKRNIIVINSYEINGINMYKINNNKLQNESKNYFILITNMKYLTIIVLHIM